MTRFRRFAHSLASGYVLMAASSVYTLASVPIALKYLGKYEFGLWALVSSIAQYVSLIDMGMIGTSRILVDHKDYKASGSYGSVIQTFMLVSGLQGLLIGLVALVLPFGLVSILKIQPEQHHEFIFLTMGQCLLLGGGFLTRIFTLLLGAHQRYDLINYPKTFLFGISLAVLWFAFAHHQGVYSTLWAQGAWLILDSIIGFFWVKRLKLLPPKGCWSRPTWGRFRELFNFGRDVFIATVGFQLLGASQTLVLTRVLGVEAAAVWNVCTRLYNIVCQMIFRIFEYSAPALAEMIVRGEKELLRKRLRALVTLSASLSVWAGVIFALCNQPFLQVWTSGRIGWPPLNDALLAASLVIQAVARCDLGLVGQVKQFRFLRYLYVLEGAFFVVLSLLVVHWLDITGLLLVSIVGSLIFSCTYGSWRTLEYFNLPWKALWLERWRAPVRLALFLVPLAALVWYLTLPLPPRPQLAICATVSVFAGGLLFLRYGLGESVRGELQERLPQRFRPLLVSLAGKPSAAG